MNAPLSRSELVQAYLTRLSQDVDSETRLWLAPTQEVVGRFMRCQLASVFQPIIDLETQDRIAREAFVRSYQQAETGLSPWSLFAQAANDEDLVALDRLCRAVHALNHFAGPHAEEPLFVNVHGRLLAAVTVDHGRAFRRVLDVLDISPRKVVIETPETSTDDLALLGFVLANYRLNGFRVSVTLTQAEQIEPLLARVRPDYIKLDVRRIRDAETAARLVQHAEQQGARVILQRLETQAQFELAQASGVRLVQGNWVGRASGPIGTADRAELSLAV